MVSQEILLITFIFFFVMCVNHGDAGDIVTEAETSKLMKVVPERDGHTVELQWAVPPESKAYKVFPCSYLR